MRLGGGAWWIGGWVMGWIVCVWASGTPLDNGCGPDWIPAYGTFQGISLGSLLRLFTYNGETYL